jgi:SecD/SecF fusion protein
VNRSSVVRALLALAVLAMSGYFVLTSSPTLGLDLRGGAQIVLEAQDTDTVVADAEATDRAIEVLRRRVDALGVSEPTLTRSGEDRIIVELPGVTDPEEAAAAIGRPAELSFHPVGG